MNCFSEKKRWKGRPPQQNPAVVVNKLHKSVDKFDGGRGRLGTEALDLRRGVLGEVGALTCGVVTSPRACMDRPRAT